MQYGRWCLQCHVEPPKATTRLEMSAASVSIFLESQPFARALVANRSSAWLLYID